MTNEIMLFVFALIWSILTLATVCFFISGLDDFFIDLVYWVRVLYQRIMGVDDEVIDLDKLNKISEQRIAVMVPCWHEAGVIEKMLEHNIFSIDYKNYNIFIGVYSNDPLTVAAVKQAEERFPDIIKCVIGEEPGPTNKAKNLNYIYQEILKYEKTAGIEYDIFVLHDSEDIIHPLSFKLYNANIPEQSMVQIPVYPLPQSFSDLTHWIYAAEFSEVHTKDMISRQILGGHVPSAGVGTGFSRDALTKLAALRQGVPFSVNSLTEDYSTALQLHLLGFKQAFILKSIRTSVWQKRWYFFGKPVLRVIKEYIATREMFPREYIKSVRQKTRWVLGIAFQEWINTGWKGNLATLYILLHDRKLLFSHLISGIFYIFLPLIIFYLYLSHHSLYYPTLDEQFRAHPMIWNLVVISTIFMAWRLLQRAIAVFRIYGIWPAICSIPLVFYGNFINLHALLRAYREFIYTTKKTATAEIKWDKTDHEFPAIRYAFPYSKKLGDILIDEMSCSPKLIAEALTAQIRTGERLGEYLLRHRMITPEMLHAALAKQYQLPLMTDQHLPILPHARLDQLSRRAYRTLLSLCTPIQYSNSQLIVVIADPTNLHAINAIIQVAKPYQVQFAMRDK